MSLLPPYKYGNCDCGCGGIDVQGRKVGKVFMCVSSYQRMKTLEQIEKQKKKNAARNTQTKLRSLSYESDSNRDMVKAYKSKSELLKEADRLFSLFIRNRDSDKNGNVACVCCGKIYNIIENNIHGDRVIQNLHFVKREVYSLRYSEYNCAAGCCYCNQDMNLNKTGRAYNQFKEKLISELGREEVEEMELAHRQINKLSEQQLKTIIEYYS